MPVMLNVFCVSKGLAAKSGGNKKGNAGSGSVFNFSLAIRCYSGAKSAAQCPHRGIRCYPAYALNSSNFIRHFKIQELLTISKGFGAHSQVSGCKGPCVGFAGLTLVGSDDHILSSRI